MVDSTRGPWRRLRDRVRQEPTDAMRHVLRTRFATIVVLIVLGIPALVVLAVGGPDPSIRAVVLGASAAPANVAVSIARRSPQSPWRSSWQSEQRCVSSTSSNATP